MSKEVMDADKSKAADAQNEAATLSAVEAKMAALQEAVKEPIVVDDEKVVTSDLADSEKSDSKLEDKVDHDKEDDDSPILPSGHRRAALARGYTTEEVDYYLKTKPDEAVARFGEIFDEWQEENSRWSERGRQLHDAGRKADGDTVEDKELPKTLSHYDAAALIKEHGNDELISALIAPLNAIIDQVNAVAGKISHSEEFLRRTEEGALVTATQDFLRSKEMESFRDAYGVEIKDLTKEQVDSRMKLFEQADIIVAGARDHGKDITVQDALERAHILVSHGTRDEAIRQSIRESLKTRTKTTKSSHQQTQTSETDQPISDEELEKRTEARQRALRDKR